MKDRKINVCPSKSLALFSVSGMYRLMSIKIFSTSPKRFFTYNHTLDIVRRIMANLASPIPMMDPNTNNDSGYAPSNIDGDAKEHTPPASPTHKETKKEEKEEEKTDAPKKPELK